MKRASFSLCEHGSREFLYGFMAIGGGMRGEM